MKADDNDKLWELLGEARQPVVSPFFSRNVLRAVRQEEPARRPLPRAIRFLPRAMRYLREAIRSLSQAIFSRVLQSSRRWAWQFAVAGTCAAAALVTVFPSAFVRRHHAYEIQPSLARQIVGNPDYEVINHLDELVADEESSLWLDDSAHDSVH
jgi:hypothetical protein